MVRSKGNTPRQRPCLCSVPSARTRVVHSKTHRRKPRTRWRTQRTRRVSRSRPIRPPSGGENAPYVARRRRPSSHGGPLSVHAEDFLCSPGDSSTGTGGFPDQIPWCRRTRSPSCFPSGRTPSAGNRTRSRHVAVAEEPMRDVQVKSVDSVLRRPRRRAVRHQTAPSLSSSFRPSNPRTDPKKLPATSEPHGHFQPEIPAHPMRHHLGPYEHSSAMQCKRPWKHARSYQTLQSLPSLFLSSLSCPYKHLHLLHPRCFFSMIPHTCIEDDRPQTRYLE